MMFLGKGCGRAKQAGLRMGDQFHRDRGHQFFKPALGAESLVKAGPQQNVLDAKAKPARNHNAAKATLRQRNVTRDAA